MRLYLFFSLYLSYVYRHETRKGRAGRGRDDGSLTAPLPCSGAERGMPLIDYPDLKCLISVPHALGLLGWKAVEVHGNRCRGPCPIHGSTSPASRSFSVTTTEWYCHKCKKGGDVLLLWAGVKGLSLYPAALDLCRAAGVEVPYKAAPDNASRNAGGTAGRR